MEKNSLDSHIDVVVIGGSAGSLEVIFRLLPQLRTNLSLAIIIVLHRPKSTDSSLIDLLATKTKMPTREVEDKDPILAGYIYLAPADYHLLVEKNFTFSLDYSEKINYSRPSLDVTFESVADAYGCSAIGILLSGANEDGSNGLKAMKKAGGIIIAQDPATAQMPLMPQNAMKNNKMDLVCSIHEMADFINGL